MKFKLPFETLFFNLSLHNNLVVSGSLNLNIPKCITNNLMHSFMGV